MAEMLSTTEAVSTSMDASIEVITAAFQAISRAINQPKAHETLCRQAGVHLDRSGAALLYKLATEGENVRPTDLAERLGIDGPAVTRKVQQLERDGLLRRSPDLTDARASRLWLTRRGRSSIERLLAARQRWLDDVLEGWSEEDRAQLARLLALFARSATQHNGGSRGA